MNQDVNNNSPKRKCAYCENNIVISRFNNEKIIYFDKKYYHSECFIELCNVKISSPRTNKEKWTTAINNIEVLEEETNKIMQDFIDKDNVYKFMLESYDIKIVPYQIFQKLSAIYNGTFVGMSVPIPPSHLLDMWKRKMHFLNKIYNKNKSTGKEFDKAHRVNYDLSVLINKYDDYLGWLKKQEILESEAKNSKAKINNNVNLQKLGKHINRSQKSDEDLDDLLDEIFD